MYGILALTQYNELLAHSCKSTVNNKKALELVQKALTWHHCQLYINTSLHSIIIMSFPILATEPD